MKKFQSLVTLFLALLLAVSVPAQAFAATEINSTHVHTWYTSGEKITHESISSEKHRKITIVYRSCTGCDQRIETRTAAEPTSHTLGSGVYTGENNHIEGAELHRARFAKTCTASGCGYTVKVWVTYYCRGNGQHIVPNSFRPVLTDK